MCRYRGFSPVPKHFVVTNTVSLLPVIPEYKLDAYFPDLETAIRTLLCLPVTAVSSESYFN